MTISKNLIKGKGGQLRDQLANHFCVWQDSMNMFGKNSFGTRSPSTVRNFSIYFARD